MYYHPVRKEANGTFVTLRQNFSVTAVGSEYYLFGGRHDTNAMDELYVFGLDSKSAIYTCEKITKEANAIWPPRRYGHAAANIIQSIIIYGGRHGSILYNDLYIFDTTKRKWFEIDITSMPPPPIW